VKKTTQENMILQLTHSRESFLMNLCRHPLPINKAEVRKEEAASKDFSDFKAYAADAVKNDRKE
jgi:hypothetical protein